MSDLSRAAEPLHNLLLPRPHDRVVFGLQPARARRTGGGGCWGCPRAGGCEPAERVAGLAGDARCQVRHCLLELTWRNELRSHAGFGDIVPRSDTQSVSPECLRVFPVSDLVMGHRSQYPYYA